MRVLLGLGLGLGVLAACSSYESSPALPDDTKRNDDAGIGTAPQGTDASLLPDGATCLARCDGDTLIACDAASTACALGCSPRASGAVCKSFDPEGPVRSDDLLAASGMSDVVFGNDSAVVVLDTNTGSLSRLDEQGGAVVLRAANADPRIEEAAGGYAFRIDGDRAIVRAVNITLGERLQLEGALPLALVASQTLRVEAAVRVPCGHLGGGHPGDVTPQTGASATAQLSGGAGGANGGGGGDGRGTPGPVARTREQGTLLGGGAGGGGFATYGGRAGAGGAGGGSVQLVAAQSIRVGRGVGDFKGINVGGCGGGLGAGSASGGGAGGTLLLEAPSLIALNDGSLVSNGGGGGNAVAGDGRFDGTPAPGRATSIWTGEAYQDTASGNGGVRASPRGGNSGSYGTDSLGTPDSRAGNAGGGGVGFVVLKSADGTVDFASVAVISPEPSVGVLTPAP